MTATAAHTCTVVIDETGARCGAAAVVTLPGGKYHECARHAGPCAVSSLAADRAAAAPAAHPRTRSTAPYLLVREGRIVGYAHSTSEAVRARAAKLGATIVTSTVAR